MNPVQKNLFLFSAVILVLLTTGELPTSIAQSRSAASERDVPKNALAAEVTGPRYRPPRRVKREIPKIDLAPEPEFISEVEPTPPTPPELPTVTMELPDRRTPLQKTLDASGMTERHRKLAEEVLSVLPESCQEKLQTFSVLYNNPQHRGLAGKGVIIVSGTVPDQEFMGLLMHEGLGHFWDITCMTGSADAPKSTFRDGSDPLASNDPSVEFYSISWINELTRKPDAKPEDFVTGYAYQSDNFEDLAESVTYYVSQEDAFRSRAQTNPILAAKLAWLEKYFPKNGTVAQGEPWNGTIAWDATKLDFQWAGTK